MRAFARAFVSALSCLRQHNAISQKELASSTESPAKCPVFRSSDTVEHAP